MLACRAAGVNGPGSVSEILNFGPRDPRRCDGETGRIFIGGDP